MSLKDLLRLADDKLEDLFNQKAHDPAKDRKKVLAGIDKTRTQFSATEPPRGRKWFSARNNVVRFSPPFEIGGKNVHHVPSERFPDYLTHLENAVKNGELDDSISSKSAPVKRRGRPKKTA